MFSLSFMSHKFYKINVEMSLKLINFPSKYLDTFSRELKNESNGV